MLLLLEHTIYNSLGVTYRKVYKGKIDNFCMEKKAIYDINNFKEFIDKYSKGNQEVNLAYGLRPSGIVHLGNLFTLALASEIVNRTGPHISKLTLSILDLDLPANQDWNFTSKKFVKHYRDLSCEGYESYAKRTQAHLEDFMEKINKEMNVPFELKFLSDLQKDSRYRKGLRNILESEETEKIINSTNNNGRIEAYPLCRECGTSYTNTIKGKINTFENNEIHSFCANPKCKVKEYKVNILDPSVDISVNALMGALRDLSCPVADAHIYGGDYSFPHGEAKVSKVSKIRKIMNIANPKKSLDFLVGPTIYAKGREKMSKSLYNGVDYNNLKKLFGEDYVKRILDFMWDVFEKEYSVVDFAVVQESLLG